MSPQNEATANTYGMGKKTLGAYIVGLLLSLVFTLCSFVIVGYHLLPNMFLYVTLALFAILQLIVQVVFFLRMNASEEGRWNLMSFLFAILIVAVIVGGSLWIMYNLNYNMVH